MNKFEQHSYLDPAPINFTLCQSVDPNEFQKSRHSEVSKITIFIIFFSISQKQLKIWVEKYQQQLGNRKKLPDILLFVYDT